MTLPYSVLRKSTVLMAASAAYLTASVAVVNAGTYTYLSSRSASQPTIMSIAALAERYSATHPDFVLEIENISDRPAYLQKVKILATSNELPDLFDADAEPFFADIAANGMVANIGEMFDDLGITDTFFPFALDYERLDDGSLYLIPFQSNAEYFFYNKTLFEAAGVTPPETLDGLLDVCKTIAAAGITPIAVDGVDQWPIFRYLSLPAFRMAGNQFLDDLRVGDASMSDPAGIASAQFLQDMGTTCFQEGFTNTDYGTAVDIFTSGNAAIFYIGTWELGSLIDENGELKPELGYFKMPGIEGSTATGANDFYVHSGIGTAIKTGSDTEELRDFILYLSENFASTMLYEFNVLPSMKPEIRPDLPQIYQDILADINAVEQYTKVWDVKLDANTFDVLGRQSQLLALGQITPEEFAAEVDQAIAQYVQSR